MKSDQMNFARDILAEVSRSFALTIPMLDEEIKDEVLLAYLQDRILDNFEDEVQKIELDLQKKLMDTVSRIFSPENYDRASDFKLIKDKAALIADQSLQRLTVNIDQLYQLYKNMSAEIQIISHKWLAEMNQGMQKFLTKKVATFADLNEYCYYVAGTVGGFLTETIIEKFAITGQQKEVLLANFNEAGLFLQKINLIRDIREDLINRDKHFWPLEELSVSEADLRDPAQKEKALQSLNLMLDDLTDHIPALHKYYLALPAELSGYKKFFAVNNGLGLATVDKLRDNPAVFYGKEPVKVAKLSFLNIIRKPEKYFLRHCAPYLN